MNMKKYLKINLILATVIFFTAFNSFAVDRDPFSPTGGSSVVSRVKDMVNNSVNQQQPADNFNSATPLTSTQLSGYKVVGVLTSDTQKIASVKAINGVSYIVKVGDSLGSEGGKISDINVDGITIQTESQEIKLPVNNKIEVPVNAAKAQ